MEFESNEPVSGSNDAHERLKVYDDTKEHTERDCGYTVLGLEEIPDISVVSYISVRMMHFTFFYKNQICFAISLIAGTS